MHQEYTTCKTHIGETYLLVGIAASDTTELTSVLYNRSITMVKFYSERLFKALFYEQLPKPQKSSSGCSPVIRNSLRCR